MTCHECTDVRSLSHGRAKWPLLVAVSSSSASCALATVGPDDLLNGSSFDDAQVIPVLDLSPIPWHVMEPTPEPPHAQALCAAVPLTPRLAWPGGVCCTVHVLLLWEG